MRAAGYPASKPRDPATDRPQRRLERFLARLSNSKHRDTFILKGAMLFRTWSPRTHRPTKDLDLLGRGAPDPARLAGLFAEMCAVVVDDDGIVFDPKSVKAARIKEDAEYEGVRVTFTGKLGTARLELQVDVGFGDAVSPEPIEIEFPTLLPMKAPRLRAYRRETVIAEKLHAMGDLGIANSRMKDFFDIWFLSHNFDFDGPVLADAIKATFAKRKTPLPTDMPFALTAAFSKYDAKQRQWKAFSSRMSKAGSSELLVRLDVGDEAGRRGDHGPVRIAREHSFARVPEQAQGKRRLPP